MKNILLCLWLIFVLSGCYSTSAPNKTKKGLSAVYNFRLGARTPTADSGMSYNDTKEKCLTILRKRIEATGSEYSIKPEADGAYMLTASNITDTAELRQMLTETGCLEFRETYNYEDLEKNLSEAQEKSKKIFATLTKRAGRESDSGGLSSVLKPPIPPNNPDYHSLRRPEFGTVQNNDTALLNKLLKDKAIAVCFPSDVEFLMGNNDPHVTFQNIYATRKKLFQLTNKYILLAVPRMDEISKNMAVFFRFNDEGARIWYSMTEKAAIMGHRVIAMCLDKKVIYAPKVDEAISGGNCRIELDRDRRNEIIANANLLAAILVNGPLPLEVVLISHQFK